MRHVLCAASLAFVLGCSGSNQSDTIWRVYEGDNPNPHYSAGKPVVSGNTVSFAKWPAKEPVTLSGTFRIEQAKTKPCPLCKKTITEQALGCPYCQKMFDGRPIKK